MARTDAAGLLALLDRPAVGVAASGVVVFGVQRLVRTRGGTWYRDLNKPRWTPPNWVFPLVWTPLKCMQAVAAWLVFRERAHAGVALPLGLFAAHLALGNQWNVVFMGRHQLRESKAWMAALWTAVAGTIVSFYPVSRPAAALMAPTLVWLSVAAKLNADIARLNTPNTGGKAE